MSAPSTYDYYGMQVPYVMEPLYREIQFIRHGGQWKGKRGQIIGNGLEFHFLEALHLLWPEVDQHRWFKTFVKEWLAHTYIGVLGPKNSGKSLDATVCHLMDYYCFPSCTTVLICSTTRERLEDRIWGEIKKYHRMACSRFPFIPGHLIEGRQRIVTDDRFEAAEGRDFRNGLIGVPCKKGDKYVGISDFQGIKNKRVRLCGDEGSALPKAFVDAIATLDIQGDQKVTLMGNPAQTTDALGLICEPHVSLGGWEGGIDQSPKTKTWKTRFENGVCIQFPGSDSPNNDEPEVATVMRGAPIYSYLMSRETMRRDMETWGKDDWHYTMFNEGRMPRGQGSRRVITRQLCLKHHAMEQPVWLNSDLTYITCLDAAYRAVGGDRCVFMRLAFGREVITSGKDPGTSLVEALVNQNRPDDPMRVVLALLDTEIIPIQAGDYKSESPEDQIVMFVKSRHEQWHLGPDNFFYDAGMRTSLVTAFARLWSPKVNAVDFGGKASERKVSRDIDIVCRDYYFNFVTELWYSVRLMIEAEQMRGLSDEIVMEGCAREWKNVGNNKIQVETKDDMKLKTGRSPDLFDCLVTGAEGARQRGFVIGRLGDGSYVETDKRWKQDLIRRAAQMRRDHSLIYST